MFRLLIAGLLIYLVWTFWKKATGAGRHAASTPHPAAPNAPSQAGTPAEMIACARCGTFVLRAEAIERSGASYCSEACAHTIS